MVGLFAGGEDGGALGDVVGGCFAGGGLAVGEREGGVGGEEGEGRGGGVIVVGVAEGELDFDGGGCEGFVGGWEGWEVCWTGEGRVCEVHGCGDRMAVEIDGAEFEVGDLGWEGRINV